LREILEKADFIQKTDAAKYYEQLESVLINISLKIYC